MKEISKYYNGEMLLRQKDKYGRQPEVFICVGNRTAGKSFFFKEYCLKRFIDSGEKFMIIFRSRMEIINCDETFFDDISIHFADSIMTSTSILAGLARELFYNNESCGYAVYLNAAPSLKKYSALFKDVKRMLFDECMEEFGSYIDREVEKLISLHITVGRGYGEQSRFVEMYLLGNNTDDINPYYNTLGVDITKLRNKSGQLVDFYRGDGFVIQFTKNISAKESLEKSSFNRAFKKNTYMKSAIENEPLHADSCLIAKERIPNATRICTLISDLKPIGVWVNKTHLYFDYSGQLNGRCFAIIDKHINNGIPYLKTNMIYPAMKKYYMNGKALFQNIEIKRYIIDALF